MNTQTHTLLEERHHRCYQVKLYLARRWIFRIKLEIQRERTIEEQLQIERFSDKPHSTLNRKYLDVEQNT
jgi:hypothetical protein